MNTHFSNAFFIQSTLDNDWFLSHFRSCICECIRRFSFGRLQIRVQFQSPRLRCLIEDHYRKVLKKAFLTTSTFF